MTAPNGQPRKCKLTECRKEFIPVTSWQEFHNAKCRNRFAWLERKAGMQFIRNKRVNL